MDLGLSRDLYESFLSYQKLMESAFRRLQRSYGFSIINGNRPIDQVNLELRKRIEAVLVGK
jgi:dTMP kinase